MPWNGQSNFSFLVTLKGKVLKWKEKIGTWLLTVVSVMYDVIDVDSVVVVGVVEGIKERGHSSG